MTKDEYKEKLRAFNSPPKYRNALDILYRLMAPQPNEKILDYGCGLGTAVREFNRHGGAQVFGYDIRNYRDHDDEHLFRSEYFFKFDKVYFMHSLAHINEIGTALINLKTILKPGARLYVITPNDEWLSYFKNEKNYQKDPTVIRHFDSFSLMDQLSQFDFEPITRGQFGSMLAGFNERLFLEAQWNG